MKENFIAPSPTLSEIPDSENKKLIDVGLIHYEASLSGLSERYSRGKTSHTIGVWWARRPHSAMRALVAAALIDEKTPNGNAIITEIGNQPVPGEKSLENVRKIISTTYGEPPRVLDMFGGAGTIAHEVANLGGKAYTIDANELSVFVQKCNLKFSQEINRSPSKEILESGERILKQLEIESRTLFPLRRSILFGADPLSIFGYIWTYSISCKECDYRFILSKRRELSKKKGRRIRLVIENGKSTQVSRIENSEANGSGEIAWKGRNGIVVCPNCGYEDNKINIRDCKDEVVALVALDPKGGKKFIKPREDAIPDLEIIKALEKELLDELSFQLPNSELPYWSGIVNPSLYGMKTHSDIFNLRQRTFILMLIKAIRDEYSCLLETKTEAHAKAITAILSSLIDQVVDWNCRLSMWIPQNEQVGRALSGPGVPMLWDYAETDQVLHGPANLWSKLERIAQGINGIPKFAEEVEVKKAHAQSLPYSDDYFDAIITDPPYYDNIFYSILADFIFSWKKPVLDLLGELDPRTNATNVKGELVASTKRSGSAKKAHEDYCYNLHLAICEAERVLKKNGVFCLVYSHGSMLGWEAIIRAYRKTKLVITSIQPLSIERRQRPRSMTSKAVNTCVVIVSRREKNNPKYSGLEEILMRLYKEFIPFSNSLVQLGWEENDAGLAAFANVVGLLANSVGTTRGNTDLDILKVVAQEIKGKINGFSMKERKPL